MKFYPLILCLVLLGLTAGCAPSPNTPESVFRDWFKASKAGNEKAAKALVDGDMLESWQTDWEQTRQLHHNYEVQISNVEVKQSDSKAKVKVAWAFSDDSGEGTSVEVFGLTKTNENWRITESGIQFEDALPVAEEDMVGKTPYDYMDEFLEAMNTADFGALQKLFSEGYFDHLTCNGERSLEEAFHKKRMVSDHFEILPDRSGYLESSPEGIFTVGGNIYLTDEWQKEFPKRIVSSSSQFPKKGGYSARFALENGQWKIVR